jgi:hypothetical protein
VQRDHTQIFTYKNENKSIRAVTSNYIFHFFGDSLSSEWEAEKGGREEDGMFHDGENTRTGQEKSSHCSLLHLSGIAFLFWKVVNNLTFSLPLHHPDSPIQ